jgi:hypothetical protein
MPFKSSSTFSQLPLVRAGQTSVWALCSGSHYRKKYGKQGHQEGTRIVPDPPSSDGIISEAIRAIRGARAEIKQLLMF